MGKKELLFDENLSVSPKALSGQLRLLLEQRKWTIHSVHEIPELVGQPDEQVIAFAKKHGYALLTLDKRMAYIAVKEQVDVYLVLHEKHTGDADAIEELTVVRLDPFASVQAQTSFRVKLSSEES
ncbi:MAG: DUF5615 family PIN-like protein [Candidatus Hermodarchaeia archaeon]|jgi:hypothetical protein